MRASGLIVDGEPINFGVKLLACIYDGAVYSPGVIINNLWNEIIVGELFGWIQGLVEGSSMSEWAIGLINNGIIDGVGAVLSFLPHLSPLLVLLYFGRFRIYGANSVYP